MATPSPSDRSLSDTEDAVGRFLADPPAGIPHEVIELLHLATGDPAAFSPPRICFETVLEAAPVLVVSLDESDQVCLDNHEYQQLLDALHGQEPIAVLRQALREQAGFDPLEALRTGRSFKDVEVSVEIPGGGGPRWFSCSGTPAGEVDGGARNDCGRHRIGGRHLLLLANDITIRRREVERAHLENLRARLAEQQMMHGVREALSAACYQMQG